MGFYSCRFPKRQPNCFAFAIHTGISAIRPSKKGNKIGLLKLDIEGGELSLLENDMDSLTDIEVVFAVLHDRIMPGCVQKFIKFSKNRVLVKDKREKFLSIKR